MDKKVSFIILLLLAFSPSSHFLIPNKAYAKPEPTLLFIYDGTDRAISSLTHRVSSYFEEHYLVDVLPVYSVTQLETLDKAAFITIFVLHGSRTDIHIGNEKATWQTFADYLKEMSINKLIVESCFSSNLLKFINFDENSVYTLHGQIDIKLAEYDLYLAIANFLMERGEETDQKVAEEAYQWVIRETTKNAWEYILLSLFPEEPLGLEIPETCGLNGPVGFFIDLIFKFLRDNGFTNIDPGFSFSQAISLTGENSLLPSQVDLALSFSWSIEYDGEEISLSGSFELPTEQPEGSKLAALLKVGGFSIGIEGEFSAVLISKLLTINSQSFVAFELSSFSFTFKIALEREIALIEFLIGGVPAASSAPYPFDEILKSISLTISFSLSLSVELDLILQVHVFTVEIGFGIELNIGIDLSFVSAEVGVGAEITFSFAFSSLGNIFSVILTVYWFIQASMAFWTGEYRQEASWEYSAGEPDHPSKSDGKQMNMDSDYDGLSDSYEEIIGTDYLINDTDNDGLLDGYEVFNLLTDPTIADTDNDGINDGEEEDYWLEQGLMPTADSDCDGIINILDSDSDNDGISDGGEKALGTSPILADTDADLIEDLVEVTGYQITVIVNGQSLQRTVYTSPTDADTDGDGIEDFIEQYYSTDPTLKDTDQDGIEDKVELQNGWNPNNQDTDGDGLNDGDEVSWGLDPSLNDTDGDGWNDGEEVSYNSQHGGILQDTDNDGIINILDIDSDNDLILDGEEVNGWRVFSYTSDPLSLDTDGDNLNDTMEYQLGCNPRNNDTDDDQLSDGEEYFGVSVTYNESWVQNGKVFTDPTTSDTDEDGKSDYDEIYGTPPSDPNDDDSDDDYLIDSYDPAPSDPDADDDGWIDGKEYQYWNETRGLGDTTATNNIQDSDVDNDGLNDWDEYTIYHTDPNSSDTDSDNLSDYQETQGFNANLNNTVLNIVTNPLDLDTDGDGLNDYYEVNTSNTDPRKADSDGDWLSDKEEIQNYNTDPWLYDTDGDKLSDYQEICYNTNPLANDTDLDNLTDYQEIFGVILDLVDNYLVHHYIRVYCDPHNPDTDVDGIPDGIEVFNYGTNPRLKDSDFDGLNDSVELTHYNTNPLDPDSDDDLVNDYIEIFGYQYTSLCIPRPMEFVKVGVGRLRLAPRFSVTPQEYYQKVEERNDTFSISYAGGLYQGLIFQYWLRSDALQLRLKQTYQGWVTNPLDPDTDSDDVIDGYEYIIGINPQDNDTDDDMLSDGDELGFVGGYGTDPLKADTDDDKLTDYQEITGVFKTINATLNFSPTSPFTNDTDHDGLDDYTEIVFYSTDPTDNDTDADLISDFDEIKSYSTNPLNNDTDADKLGDYDEINIYKTSPLTNDTDGDGFTDYYELNHPPLSPLDPDYDNDGIPDGMEEEYGLSWNNSDENNNGIVDGKEHDYDNDGLTDYQELYETNSLLTDIDTDDDMLNDSVEAELWTNLNIDPSSDLDGDGATNLWDKDSDGDGLTDYNETYNIGTNPGLFDTDGDLLNDGDEIIHNCNGTNPDTDGDGSIDGLEVFYYNSSPLNSDENINNILDGKERDYDNDTISDWDELYKYGTNQLLSDTDGDNVPDNIEIQAGTNATNKDDYPTPTIIQLDYPYYIQSSEQVTVNITVIQTVPIVNATLYWYYDNEKDINRLLLDINQNTLIGTFTTKTGQWEKIHCWVEIIDIYGHSTVSQNFTIYRVIIETTTTTNTTDIGAPGKYQLWIIVASLSVLGIGLAVMLILRFRKRKV